MASIDGSSSFRGTDVSVTDSAVTDSAGAGSFVETPGAGEQILAFLVDGLLVEGLLDSAKLREDDDAARRQATAWFGAAAVQGQTRLWDWQTPQGERLVMLLEPGIVQAWQKVPATPVLVVPDADASAIELDAPALMRLLCQAKGEPEPEPAEANGDQPHSGLTKGQQVFLRALEDSLWQAEASMHHGVRTDDLEALDTHAHFVRMEQWASLLDRPYHPTAKAKQGMSADEYQAYMAEFARPVGLVWVAVARHRLCTGAGLEAADGGDVDSVPADWVLAHDERQTLQDELRNKGIDQTHVALPVHPWQHEHALPTWLATDLEEGHCVTLETVTGGWWPTSSLRSLLSTRCSEHSLKLPMAIHSLGASRYLPAVKMINGDLSARLLAQARQRDPVLASALHLCDEGKWWAYMPEDASLFEEAPRHLSAMVRSYPRELLAQRDVQLVPMATLGTPLPSENSASAHHLFSDWMDQRGMEHGTESARVLFGELCSRFFEINLRMLRLGMLAEVHGQNAVLVVRDGQVEGLLLRDHDSLRIHVGQLERHGMQDPCYRIKKGHANTLYHDTQEALVFWLQTLAVQVNLRAIIDTVAGHFGLSSRALWQDLCAVLDGVLDAVPFEDGERRRLKAVLFERESWPYKRLIAPIIERAGGPGSMPFGVSETVNPLRACQGEPTHQTAEANASVEQGVSTAAEADHQRTLQQA
ncbi:IucA/IucC family protein [Halomonas litopenaei]|uniref:IucA/IucC family protein n=1 Tax=Halomonas litopenaei TaxID=2109328 RepID=UPI001A8D471C|nr:IucA/IucC family protein [Halomonas litopenaei]MBN8411455.1 AcsA protein [Halomonas litopenaei]